MSDDGWLGRLVRATARTVGRRYAEAGRTYRDSRSATRAGRLYDQHARIVCRRYVQKRTVVLDGYEPDCFEAGHPDCEGCVEDIREGAIETW